MSAELPDRELADLLNRQVDRYQEVVKRLAGNGVQVKTWCITVIAGISAIAAANNKPELLAIGLVVALAFLYLDAYYLCLERHFRDTSNALADKARQGRLPDWSDLFRIEAPGATTAQALRSAGRSLAVSPFYGAIVLLLLAALVVSL